MTTALIIATYNRLGYLQDCLETITWLSELPDHLVFVDDASDWREGDVIECLQSFGKYANIEKHLIRKIQREGVKTSLLGGFSYVFDDLKCDLAMNLDSDAIVSPNFITRLKDLKTRYPDHIISGFNCNNPKNPILYEGEDYVLRRHCNGINMCLDKNQYETIVKPALQTDTNWDYASTHNLPFVISKPSVVQHIGMVSSMGHSVNPDIACDFHV